MINMLTLGIFIPSLTDRGLEVYSTVDTLL